MAAPTGSGKTLAAFLAAINELVLQSKAGELEDETSVVYVSPLKALSNDIQKNLEAPLSGIQAELAIRGFPAPQIRTMVRTGDTPARDRQAMVRRPPHIVVTTPESLFILLTSERGRKMLSTVKTVIVDEIHAMVGSKRGSHLALTLARLENLVQHPLVRVGLSATQNPIEEVAKFLVGSHNLGEDGTPECAIVDSGHVRNLDLALEVPGSPLEAVMSGEVWEEVHERLAQLIQEHRTTLVFVNTRRMAERVAKNLTDRLGGEGITSHHGSLSKEQRLSAEDQLRSGKLKALVATASLELGIDIGEVDLVCQLGSTRSIAAFLQRVGRSGHAVDGLPKGRLFPLSRDELVECAALLDAVRRQELDRLHIPEFPLDILAQQIVAAVACEEWKEDDLLRLVREAYPYRELPPKEFDAVLHMVAHGFTTRRGRRGAYVYRDGVNRRLRPRRGARLAAITSGGSIPDTADYRVILEPAGTLVGTVNEDFAIESMAGDIFQLGNTSWLILRVETGIVRVADAQGQPPTIPFWLGEAPGRTSELSLSVSRLRQNLDERLIPWYDSEPMEIQPGAGSNQEENGSHHENGSDGTLVRDASGLKPVRAWLKDQIGDNPDAVNQIVDYMAAAKATLGVIPTQKTLVMERFFDETGGMQLVIHSPFGSRPNRAWGLALRKRFCRKFNFELQAAATEDAIILSLGPTHSFPLEEVYHYLNPATVRDILVQALLDAPMFATRWRWNSGRALAVLRFQGGKRVPPQLQRMQAEDLLSLVFPDQLACFENIQGDREIPDHPLVSETIRDCLYEAMEIERLENLLTDIQDGSIKLVARDLREPSPLAAEILNAKPYAFLDDAPLEERRTQAVIGRRWLDPTTASDLGALDLAAIDRVRDEAWPEAASADELHDALMLIGFLTETEGSRYSPQFLEELMREHRATKVYPGKQRDGLWVPAERLMQFVALFPDAELRPVIASPDPTRVPMEEALREIVRSRLEALGPVTAEELGRPLRLSAEKMEIPLVALETEGFVIRGSFTPGTRETEWCDRRLLARIHRYTLNRLRREIEPVPAADFMRFLFEWHGVSHGEKGEGPGALTRVLEMLEGFESAAVAWEADIFPTRLIDYDPAWLDSMCLSGRIAWARLHAPKKRHGRGAGPVRNTPITFLDRRRISVWLEHRGGSVSDASSLPSGARTVFEYLFDRGASFFSEIADGSGLLRTQVEEALGELVAWGLITADGFTGLRALLVPAHRKKRNRSGGFTIEDAGRWTLLGERIPEEPEKNESGTPARDSESGEIIARALLRRYGVVFRRLLDREGPAIPWRDLLRIYHRLEARGEIRGGRFVAGFSGEQFALPEAVAKLRDIRRRDPDHEWISVGGADPLNLAGVITPGPRVPALPGNRVLYRDGVPLAIQVAGDMRILGDVDPGDEWKVRKTLVRKHALPRLRSYIGAPGR